MLYQGKKTWQWACASWIEPKRSGNAGRYFSVFELRLRERVVVGHGRPGMGLGHAQVGQQEGNGLRGHCRAAVGVDSELLPADALARARFADELLGQRGGFRNSASA